MIPAARRRFLKQAATLLMAPVLMAPLSGVAGALPVAARASGFRPPVRARGNARIDVRNEGARGDGRHDDTQAFQDAVDALPDAGGTVYVPSGTYIIDPVRSVRLRSRMHLQLAAGATLWAKPNAAEHAYVLLLYRAQDVEISGGQIIGERDAHQADTGEWGHGIQLRGASRVTIRDMRISKCWGDGICIGDATIKKPRQVTPSEDVAIARVVCTGNRRQGLSIGHSRNVRVHDSEFSDTSGTPPSYGIDIEPDEGDDIRQVHIENCLVRGNSGGGIEVYKPVTDVAITRCVIEKNGGYGVLAIGASKGLIVGNTIRNNGWRGVGLRRNASDFLVEDNRFADNMLKFRARHPERAKTALRPPRAAHIETTQDVQGIRIGANDYSVR